MLGVLEVNGAGRTTERTPSGDGRIVLVGFGEGTSQLQPRVVDPLWVPPQVNHSRQPARSDMMEPWPIVGGGFFGGLAPSGSSS
jgi:hypothetical protein